MRITISFCFILLFFPITGYTNTPEGQETTIEGKQGSMFFYWGYPVGMDDAREGDLIFFSRERGEGLVELIPNSLPGLSGNFLV